MSELAETIEQGVSKDKDFVETGDWGITGKGKTVRPKTLPELQGESVMSSWGRYISNWWLGNNMSMRALIILVSIGTAYVFWYYFRSEGYYLVALVLISSAVGGKVISDWHLKRYEWRVRVPKIKDDIKVVSTELNGSDVTMKVMKAELKAGEDAWQEYSMIDPVLIKDAAFKPRMLGVTPIHTGYATYIFAKDFDLENRMLVGDGEEFPGIALIPMLYNAQTTLPQVDKWIEQVWRKGKIKPEEAEDIIKRLNSAIGSYNKVMEELKERGVKGIKMEDLKNPQQKFVIGLDSLGSKFFAQYREYREMQELPEEVRHAAVMNAVNTAKEYTTLLSYLLENMALLEQKAMSDAFGVLQNLSGITSEQIKTRFKEFDLELKERLMTKKEKELMKEATGEAEV